MQRCWIGILAGGSLAASVAAAELGVGWPSYGGDPGGTRYSKLAQITPQNVASLAKAWEYQGERDLLPGHADPLRGLALLLYAVQPHGRARPGDRARALELRSEGRR
ncbi:MAG TPA: hypothetical protein VMQ50_12750 [Casimicrobiaceae bacterium]|nr:hypothetical protein [Casimicrobiaceae bacterium]